MENYTHTSSRDSSPRSREVDADNPSWEDQPSSNNYKVKFVCSYGGKIQPRSHDNQLAYIGGETKILAVDRAVKFNAFISKLSSLRDADVCFKYQLPGEDLDTLISVTNDEDLEHMMVEYDRLYRGSAKPARIRLFLFPLPPSAPTSLDSNDLKSDRQWFVDALNSVQIQPLEGSSPPVTVTAASAGNPDFLFGLDKGYTEIPAAKLPDSAAPPTTLPHIVPKDLSAGSDGASEDRQVVGEQGVPPGEVHRQIQELRRLHLANNEHVQRKSEEGNPRVFPVDQYSQKNPENVPPAPVPVSVPVSAAAYLPERHMTTAGYPVAATEQPVYFIQTPTGVYRATTLPPMAGPVGQPYYGLQRMVPTEVYNTAPPPPASLPPHSQTVIGAYSESTRMAQQKVGLADAGYTQVGYDHTGRQYYYTPTPGGAPPPPHQMVAAGVDGRQGGGLSQEGKVGAKVSHPQASTTV